MSLSVEIIGWYDNNGSSLTRLDNLSYFTTISDVKDKIVAKFPPLCRDRLALKNEPYGEILTDETPLESLEGLSGPISPWMRQLMGVDVVLYCEELDIKPSGPQIDWRKAFLVAYTGALMIYLLIYLAPGLLYSEGRTQAKPAVVDLACYAHTFHYIKRFLETLFIHRFSQTTIPSVYLFRLCFYYWGFAALISYYINHQNYTAPSSNLTCYALIAFLLCEFGNFSIHVLLRNLRPAPSKVYKIPYPNGNPFTLLFNLVSCPHYTYEIGSWLSFAIMTQSAPAFIFMFCGAAQMTNEAQGKHYYYRKKFKNYPRSRSAIFPFTD